jgi:hypothetical protein
VGMMRTSAIEAMSTIGLGRLDHSPALTNHVEDGLPVEHECRDHAMPVRSGKAARGIRT